MAGAIFSSVAPTRTAAAGGADAPEPGVTWPAPGSSLRDWMVRSATRAAASIAMHSATSALSRQPSAKNHETRRRSFDMDRYD